MSLLRPLRTWQLPRPLCTCGTRHETWQQCPKQDPARCTEKACDGETHYTGDRDPFTNEDVEAGPCPLAGGR